LVHYNLFAEGEIAFIMFSSTRANEIVKAITFILLIATSVLILSHCKKDNQTPRSYPRLRNTVVSDITEKGAGFAADLYSMGTEKIIEHGFVWGTTDPNIHYSDRIQLGPCDTPGIYSAYIASTLRKDIKYIVKPYVQTADHVVYGIPIDFKSLGSSAPLIYDFEPHTAEWLDTITITGKNFSFLANENIVKLNQTVCDTWISTDSTLKVIVNSSLSDLKSIVSIDLNGNVAVHTKDTFSLIPPVINSFYPAMTRWGDTITITGEHFKSEYSVTTISAAISGVSTRIINKKKDALMVLVPEDLVNLQNSVSLKINNLNIVAPEKLSLLSPVISSISPSEGTWWSILTLKGVFNPKQARNIIKIGGFTAQIISVSRDSIKAEVPGNISNHNNIVVLTSAPFTVMATDTFKLFGPYIQSISPLSGNSEAEVLIRGNYFGYYPIVEFGTEEAYILEKSNSMILCRVPTGLIRGPVKIKITAGLQNSVYKDDFIVTNPYVSNVYPLTGTFNDEITIEGENLVSSKCDTYVYFYNYPFLDKEAEIVSKAYNKLVIKIPTSIDSIPKTLGIQVGAEFFYSRPFVLSPPEITSISTPVLSPGQDVTISGINFNPVFSNNKVFWGIYPLTVKSSTSTVIVASVPLGIPQGNFKISVKVGGYKRVYPVLYEIISSGSAIMVPPSMNRNTYGGLNAGLP
jgi:hypothetical protein